MRLPWLPLVACAAAACGHAGAASCPPGPDACLAERIPDPSREVPFAALEAECATHEDVCAESCRRGDANACFGRARVHQARGESEEAETFFELACERGSMLGCTNRAAGMMLTEEPAEECVARVLERTCEAAEPWGCGMYGLVLIQGSGVPRDPERGRAVLTQVCATTVHPFGCAVLSRALEQGMLGAVDHDEAAKYRRLACARGDVESCAEPAAVESAAR